MVNPGWKLPRWCLSPRAKPEGTTRVPSRPHRRTLLARCLGKVATQVGLELYFNSAAQFPGHISGSEPVGKRRYQVQCLSALQMELCRLTACLLFITILSEPRALFSNSQSIMEASLIFLGIKLGLFIIY